MTTGRAHERLTMDNSEHARILWILQEVERHKKVHERNISAAVRIELKASVWQLGALQPAVFVSVLWAN